LRGSFDRPPDAVPRIYKGSADSLFKQPRSTMRCLLSSFARLSMKGYEACIQSIRKSRRKNFEEICPFLKYTQADPIVLSNRMDNPIPKCIKVI